MTKEQLRLAVADTAFVASWLLMNFFWMWERYDIGIALAIPTAMTASAAVYYTERSAVPLFITGSNAGWFLKDFFWMMENSGQMPDGVIWGTTCFVLTLACIVAALAIGAGAGTVTSVMERLKRIRLLILRR